MIKESMKTLVVVATIFFVPFALMSAVIGTSLFS